MIKAILFDLDGLMFDSEPHSLASWEAVLAERGVKLDQPTIDSILGQRIDATARILIDKYHLPDTVQDLADAKTDYQITHLAGKVKPMPGLIELLDEIDRREMPKAIASSGSLPRDHHGRSSGARQTCPRCLSRRGKSPRHRATRLPRAGRCAERRAGGQSGWHDVHRRARS